MKRPIYDNTQKASTLESIFIWYVKFLVGFALGTIVLGTLVTPFFQHPTPTTTEQSVEKKPEPPYRGGGRRLYNA